MTERERSEFNQSEAKVRTIHRLNVTHSQERLTEHQGSPAPKKPRLLGLGGQSLLEIWKSR